MKQQYVLLRQENDLLNELKGRTFNDRLKDDALKILNEIHDKADFTCPEKTLCYVVRDNVLKGVGGSTLMKNTKTGKLHSDLILDNYGKFMAGIFKGLVGGANLMFLVDEVGATRTLRVYTTSNQFNDAVARRVVLQVGGGITPPARDDFDIETALGTAPENVFFDCNIPVWISANGTFKNTGNITAGGSGTINESILQHHWTEAGAGVSGIFTSFRDSISPGVAFIPGDGIIVEYTVQL